MRMLSNNNCEPHTSESNSAIAGKCRILWGEPERVSVHYISKWAFKSGSNAKHITRTPLRLIIVCARADRMEATGSLQAQ